MKSLLSVLIVAVFVTTASAQHVQPQFYRYNLDQHSARRQAKFVTTIYRNRLTLSWPQEHAVYCALLSYYRSHQGGHLRFRDATDVSARLATQGAGAHEMLDMKMKSILSADQLAAYNDMHRYPEEAYSEAGQQKEW